MTNRCALQAIFCSVLMTALGHGQGSAPATIAPRTQNQSPQTTVKNTAENTRPGSDSTPKTGEAKPGTFEPIVTEIYADKTVFDSGKSIGIFTGNVVVTDPRFNIQGDMMT